MTTVHVRARHASAARSTPARLAARWLTTGRWQLLPLFLSDYGRALVRDKYDAFNTDRAYECRARGRIGLDWLVDWIVLRQTLHRGLRARLLLVVDELARAIAEQDAAGAAPVRVLSAPSGLGRDLVLAYERLSRARPVVAPELWAVDLDSSGTVLQEAARRAAAAAVPLRTLRHDLLGAGPLRPRLGGDVHVASSIGLTAWLDLAEVARLLARFRELMRPGGALLVDNFRVHPQSRFGPDLEMETRYHATVLFERTIEGAGFRIERRRETPDAVNVVYRATAC